MLAEHWHETGIQAHRGHDDRRLPEPVLPPRPQHRPWPQLGRLHDRVPDPPGRPGDRGGEAPAARRSRPCAARPGRLQLEDAGRPRQAPSGPAAARAGTSTPRAATSPCGRARPSASTSRPESSTLPSTSGPRRRPPRPLHMTTPSSPRSPDGQAQARRERPYRLRDRGGARNRRRRRRADALEGRERRARRPRAGPSRGARREAGRPRRLVRG